MQSFWNERYRAAEYVYGVQPNAFFKDCLSGISPGRILLPADGEGRNAVYAAQHGWEVRSFDYSEEAVKKTQALSESKGVHVNCSVEDIATFQWPHQAFDVVGLCFVHMPEPMRLFLHQQVMQALRPGGFLILEAFTPRQLLFQSGGPRDVQLLFTLDMLRHDFKELNLLLAEETDTILAEGPFHSGPAAVVHLFAQKA